jgi:hypothetical protein
VTSLYPSDFHDSFGAKASITTSSMKITDVTVQCASNKVVFDDRFTLDLRRYVIIDKYAVPDVAPRESFTADCNFAWSLWMRSTDGFFILGGGRPGVPELGIAFYLTNGLPTLINPSGTPTAVKSDLVGYSSSPVIGIDGSFVIRYSWPMSWFRHRKAIHMIASRDSQGKLSWRVAPESEPIISDAALPNGFTVTAKGPDMGFGVILKRGN